MLHRIRRHPFPVHAFFRHSLVLTYGLPRDLLSPLLPSGLELDSFGDHGFLAIAMVQAERLRPSFVPRRLGCSFFLSGYRIFSRYVSADGRRLRGLRILRSDTDRRLMVLFGNLLTHYRYHLCSATVSLTGTRLRIEVATPSAEADVAVMADLASKPALPPAGSPFRTIEEARRFAGPLPFTFDYEAETNSIIRVQGHRERWDPEPVSVEVERVAYFRQPAFRGVEPVLANAFYVHDLPYRWSRGVREPLPCQERQQA